MPRGKISLDHAVVRRVGIVAGNRENKQIRMRFDAHRSCRVVGIGVSGKKLVGMDRRHLLGHAVHVFKHAVSKGYIRQCLANRKENRSITLGGVHRIEFAALLAHTPRRSRTIRQTQGTRFLFRRSVELGDLAPRRNLDEFRIGKAECRTLGMGTKMKIARPVRLQREKVRF